MRDPHVQLTKQILGGDRSAFWKLLKQHYGPILRISHYFLRNGPEAESTALQICLDLPKWLVSYQGQCSFDVFLFQIIQNTYDGLDDGENRYAVDVSATDPAQVRRIISAKSPIAITKGTQDRTISTALSAFDKLELSDERKGLAKTTRMLLTQVRRTVLDRKFMKMAILAASLAIGTAFAFNAVRNSETFQDFANNFNSKRRLAQKLRNQLELLDKSLQGDIYGEYLDDESRKTMIKVSENYPSVLQDTERFSRSDWQRLKLAKDENKSGSETKNDTTKFHKTTTNEPISLIPIGLGSESYSIVRLALGQKKLPQQGTVQAEELINHFTYDYPPPDKEEDVFKSYVSIFPNPWNEQTKLLHIGIKGYESESNDKRRRVNLVLLIESQESLNNQSRLVMVKEAIQQLVEDLDPESSLALITFGEGSSTILSPTKIKEKEQILKSLVEIENNSQISETPGFEAAIEIAKQQFDPNCVNRIAVISDGKFNGGIEDEKRLKELLNKGQLAGIFSSAVGLGIHYYRDELHRILERLGFEGIAYTDNKIELQKAFSDLTQNTASVIARDIEVQLEFNPNTVSEYRLIGYETRLLDAEKLGSSDANKANQISALQHRNIRAGYEFTALYEIKTQETDTEPVGESAVSLSKNYAQLQVSFESPPFDSRTIKAKAELANNRAVRIIEINGDNETQQLNETSAESRFVAAVAAFAQLLRNDPNIKKYGLDDVIALAVQNKGPDRSRYREEFISLVNQAKTISQAQLKK